jgi:cytochrome P450
MNEAPAHVPTSLVVDFDLYNDPGFADDVHATIAGAVARFPPVCFTLRNGGHWLVFGRTALQQVLGDTERFSSRQLSLQPGASTAPRFIPLSLDPPDHAPYRNLLLKHLGPKEIRGLEPFIRGWAERLIAPLEGRTECDFVAEVAEAMPVSVFMEMMGLPLDRFHEFRGLVINALTPRTPPEERMTLHGRIMAVLSEVIQARSAEPRDDLVSKLLSERIEGRPLSQEEMFSICYLLFLAGLDTVTNAMAYGMRHLAGDPALQARLRADPALIPAAVEDLMRRFTFVNTVRVAVKDTELDGVAIKDGDLLACVLWGGSNGGEDTRQFGFGHGPHTCLGMHLARTELRIMYETWFAHIGEFSPGEQPSGACHGGTVMGISSVPLRLGAAA